MISSLFYASAFTMKSLFQPFIIFLFLRISSGQKFPYDGRENEMTMIVQARGIECFFQEAKVGNILEIDYQVIDAGYSDMDVHGDLNINFHLYSPVGETLVTDIKESDSSHKIDIKQDGEYKFCFDNSFSQITKKSVYFEVYVDSEAEDDKWEAFDFPPEMLYNDTMDSIKMSIGKVRQNLNTIKHHQDQLKAIETRDRNLQEHNFTRVNHFSMLFIVVMIIVGAIQVIMVRSLFEENSKLHKIFKIMS